METIKESNHFSKRVLRDMSSGVLVLDVTGQIVYCNNPAAKMLEIKEGTENIALRVEETEYNDDFNEFIFQSVFDKENAHQGTVRYITASGKKYVFRMSSSYLDVDGDNPAQIVITLNDETEREKLKVKLNDSSATFSIFLIGLCVWLIIYAAWFYSGMPFNKNHLTGGVEVLGVLIFVFVRIYTSLDWKDLGLISKNPKKEAIISLLIAFIAFIVMGIMKLIVLRVSPNILLSDKFFDFSKLGILQFKYLFTSLIQEFLARSGIQGNIKRITTSKYPALVSIIMSSLIFAVLHIHLGLVFMAGAALLAGLLGIMYDRQESIMGVWIVHYLIGVFGTIYGFIH